MIVYLPFDSFEQRSRLSSIVPPGWIATKKVSSRGPDPSELPRRRPAPARRQGRGGQADQGLCSRSAGFHVLSSMTHPQPAQDCGGAFKECPREALSKPGPVANAEAESAGGEQGVERLLEAGDRRVERRLVAGGAGAHQGALDRRDDEAGEGLGVLGADAFVAQGRGDRRFPALEGGGRGGGERRVLGAGQGGGGDRAADPLGVVG